ncbi:MAG: hypothetical protein DRQ49_02355 [Gammaproteobacteria bacterium]|nr:MAG: hypothetical protein DRQ49_02355 [Gammaproteobacteria bacterium]
MRRKPIISIAITLLLVSIGQSVVVSRDALASSCEDTESLLEMNKCAKDAYNTSETRLNEMYKNVKESLNYAEKSRFNKAHRKWNAFRESYCEFATYALRNEPGLPFHKNDCLDRITKQYIENLEKYMEDLDV